MLFAGPVVNRPASAGAWDGRLVRPGKRKIDRKIWTVLAVVLRPTIMTVFKGHRGGEERQQEVGHYVGGVRHFGRTQ